MTGGLLDYAFEAAQLRRDTGCTPAEALEIVVASYEPEPEPPKSNVIRMSDFARRREDKTIGAL
jgi:hypothetical protein